MSPCWSDSTTRSIGCALDQREHAVGRASARRFWARKPAGTLELSARIKRALDPDNRLNPASSST